MTAQRRWSQRPIETVSLPLCPFFVDPSGVVSIDPHRRTFIVMQFKHLLMAMMACLLLAVASVGVDAHRRAREQWSSLPLCSHAIAIVCVWLCCCCCCYCRCVSVEARSVAQLKAAVLAEQSARLSASASALPDAPVGAKVADLAKYAGAKKVVQVKPSGIAAQLPGDKENNEDAIKATEFDLRWAVRTTRRLHSSGWLCVAVARRVVWRWCRWHRRNEPSGERLVRISIDPQRGSR